jgi:hypothetical protein
MITRPSLMSFLMWVRELAFPISDCSAGSSQILRLPTPATDAASRFCERRLTMATAYTRQPLFVVHTSRVLTEVLSGLDDVGVRWAGTVL